MFQKAKLRGEVSFNNLMGSIISVLKGVAATEYGNLQASRSSFDEFENHLKEFLRLIKPGDFQHPFLGVPAAPNNIVLITSDTGFLGKLNISVVSAALEQYRSGDLLTVIGRQGSRYIEEEGIKFTYFPGIGDDISDSEVAKLRDHIIRTFLKRKGRTIIIYPHFVSFSVQRTQQSQLLPCRFLFSEESDRGPENNVVTGGFLSLLGNEELIVEPSLKRVVEYIVKVWVGQLVNSIFWESKLSEWAARVMHLEKSSNEVKNQNKKLRLQYFRLLHEISDKNTREIFASRFALARSRD